MNKERVSCLISLYLDGALSPSERVEFEGVLLTSSAARAQFWSETKLHDQLRLVEQDERTSEVVWASDSKGFHVLPSRVAREKFSWLIRPIAAAAAGIVLSALCTSVVWAYAGHKFGGRTVELPISNPGFESTDQMEPNGIPDTTGKWSGDFSWVVGAENGIQPHGGKQMLRILRADNALAKLGSLNYVGEAVQVFDLRSLRSEVCSGTAQIEITGWFAAIPTDESQFHFLIKAATFRGDLKDAPALWEDVAHSGISMVQHQVPATGTLSKWQPLTVSIPVPSTADFLVFECGVLRHKPAQFEGTVEFPGHYVDDISLRLRVSNQSVIPLSALK